MSGTEYFPGCSDVELFDAAPFEPIAGPLSPQPNASLADAVRAAEARRVVDDGQLSLPAELMPVPAGALFA